VLVTPTTVYREGSAYPRPSRRRVRLRFATIRSLQRTLQCRALRISIFFANGIVCVMGGCVVIAPAWPSGLWLVRCSDVTGARARRPCFKASTWSAVSHACPRLNARARRAHPPVFVDLAFRPARSSLCADIAPCAISGFFAAPFPVASSSTRWVGSGHGRKSVCHRLQPELRRGHAAISRCS